MKKTVPWGWIGALASSSIFNNYNKCDSEPNTITNTKTNTKNPDYYKEFDNIRLKNANMAVKDYRNIICNNEANIIKFNKFFRDPSSKEVRNELKDEYTNCHNLYILITLPAEQWTYFHVDTLISLYNRLVAQNKFTDELYFIFNNCIYSVLSKTNVSYEYKLIQFILDKNFGFYLEYIQNINDNKTVTMLFDKFLECKVFAPDHSTFIFYGKEMHADIKKHDFAKSNGKCFVKLLERFLGKVGHRNILDLIKKTRGKNTQFDSETRIKIYNIVKKYFNEKELSDYIVDLYHNDKETYLYVVSDTKTLQKYKNISELINEINSQP
jgi:hypothetical protein